MLNHALVLNNCTELRRILIGEGRFALLRPRCLSQSGLAATHGDGTCKTSATHWHSALEYWREIRAKVRRKQTASSPTVMVISMMGFFSLDLLLLDKSYELDGKKKQTKKAFCNYTWLNTWMTRVSRKVFSSTIKTNEDTWIISISSHGCQQ